MTSYHAALLYLKDNHVYCSTCGNQMAATQAYRTYDIKTGKIKEFTHWACPYWEPVDVDLGLHLHDYCELEGKA